MQGRTAIHDRVAELRRGENPYVVARLETCWVVVSNRPLLEGHCVTFADPVVFGMNDLDEETRMKYARDVCRVGDALIKVTGAYRINYETMCNVAQALHTHIFPRQLWERSDERKERPAVAYREKELDLSAARPLIEKLKVALAPFAVEIK
jgi:diadenosine tetraphosphate (Ap4A) HIT family hydrolase